MSIFKGIFDTVIGAITAPINVIKNTIFKGIAGKVTTQIVNYVVAAVLGFIAAPEVAPILQQAGITVDPTQLAIGIGALAEAIRKYLKEKFHLPLG